MIRILRNNPKNYAVQQNLVFCRLQRRQNINLILNAENESDHNIFLARQVLE